MKSVVTVIRPDNSVVVDGVGRTVDCSALSSYVKAIQWTGTAGWIEFMNDGGGRFEPNQPIVSFEPYMHLVEKWTEAGKPPEAEPQEAPKTSRSKRPAK